MNISSRLGLTISKSKKKFMKRNKVRNDARDIIINDFEFAKKCKYFEATITNTNNTKKFLRSPPA